MGLIERVLGKIHHRVIDMGCDGGADPLGDAARNALFGIAVDKIAPLLLHDFLLLLGHGAPHQIASSERIAAQIPHDLHDLFLIYDAPVGRLENGLEFLRVIGDLVRVLLAVDILGDEVHGPRPVQRDSGYDIFEVLRMQLFHESLHAAGFQLEDAVCPACGN